MICIQSWVKLREYISKIVLLYEYTYMLCHAEPVNFKHFKAKISAQEAYIVSKRNMEFKHLLKHRRC